MGVRCSSRWFRELEQNEIVLENLEIALKRFPKRNFDLNNDLELFLKFPGLFLIFEVLRQDYF